MWMHDPIIIVLGVVIVCTVDGELMFFSKYKDNVINLINSDVPKKR